MRSTWRCRTQFSCSQMRCSNESDAVPLSMRAQQNKRMQRHMICKESKRAVVRACAIFIVATFLLCGPGLAQPADPALNPPPDRELVIGTKEAPPFAIKTADGAWEGISIDLWRRIADAKKWRYRFV